VPADGADGYVQPYSPCAAITPDGKVARNRSVRTTKLMTVDQALGALRSGQRAVVAPADAEKVLENLRAGMV